MVLNPLVPIFIRPSCERRNACLNISLPRSQSLIFLVVSFPQLVAVRNRSFFKTVILYRTMAVLNVRILHFNVEISITKRRLRGLFAVRVRVHR